ncbi:YdcF family protein [Clostridium estertheticum]|nr:YdcF family protein [Clostridium estertheticum]
MILLYILCLILLYFMILYIVICYNFKKSVYNNGQKSDVIIVLGYHAKKNGNVSPILRERITKASRLYHDGIAKTIICSGAAVGNDNIEADVMAKALIELGIPDYSIIREKLSKNTYGNLKNSKETMQSREFKTAVIVSSPWHLRKASTYAFKLDIDHTVEKSKFPYEYLIIGVAMIYLYYYTQMFINIFRYYKVKQVS